jgi:hypothetical protein
MYLPEQEHTRSALAVPPSWPQLMSQPAFRRAMAEWLASAPWLPASPAPSTTAATTVPAPMSSSIASTAVPASQVAPDATLRPGAEAPAARVLSPVPASAAPAPSVAGVPPQRGIVHNTPKASLSDLRKAHITAVVVSGSQLPSAALRALRWSNLGDALVFVDQVHAFVTTYASTQPAQRRLTALSLWLTFCDPTAPRALPWPSTVLAGLQAGMPIGDRDDTTAAAVPVVTAFDNAVAVAESWLETHVALPFSVWVWGRMRCSL